MNENDKGKKIKKMMDNFMGKMGEELLDDEVYQEISCRIKHMFKMDGVPFSKTHLKSFYLGLSLMEMAIRTNENFLEMFLKVGTQRQIKEIEDRVEKQIQTSELK